MKIKDILLTEGVGGYYSDDLQAIKHGAKQDGFFYIGKPLTPGFSRIRQPAECVSVILILENGGLGIGDCFALQYAGAGNRDPVFEAKKHIPLLGEIAKRELIAKDVASFREFSQFVDSLEIDGQRLHSGIKYGLSQAALSALANLQKRTMAEIIADEYHLTISDKMIPIMAQSGEDRHIGADKMILRKVEALPHGLFSNVESIGEDGEKLVEYIKWVKERIKKFGDKGYMPWIHVDVYGSIGEIFNCDLDRITLYLTRLGKTARPYHLRVESPVYMENKEKQISTLAGLKKHLSESNIDVEIVADDRCNSLEDVKDFVDNNAVHMIQVKPPPLGSLNNTIEAIIYCKQNKIGAYLGGSCTGTDVSARINANIALATQADQVLGRPGMGVDVAIQIIYNEMKLTLALVQYGKRARG